MLQQPDLLGSMHAALRRNELGLSPVRLQPGELEPFLKNIHIQSSMRPIERL